MRKKILLATTAMLFAVSFGATAEAGGRTAKDSRDAEIQELKARLDRLEQQQAEDQRAAQDAAVQEQSRLLKIEKTPVTLADGRPCFNTNDNSFQACLRGRIQLDVADYEIDLSDLGASIPSAQRDLGSGAVFRRLRFGVEGRFFTDFIYEIRFDFGGTDTEGSGIINIARVGWAPSSIPGLRVHVGALQPILTMYDATSSAELPSIERAAVVTTLVGAFGGDNGRRGVEATYQKENLFYQGDNFMISSAFTGDRVDGNGVGHSGSNIDDEKTQLVGRLAYRFYSDPTTNTNLQIGGSAAEILSASGTTPGAARTIQLRERPEIRVDGTRWVDTGAIPISGGLAYGLEAAAQFQNFWIGGEWYKMDLDRDLCPSGCNNLATKDPSFSGWYVEGTWIITGEAKRYVAAGTNNNVAVWRGPAVANPVGFAGGVGNGWGAFELTTRYSVLNLNSDENDAVTANRIRGGEQKIWNLGVNWYLNANLKSVLEYAMVDVDRSSCTAIAGGGCSNALNQGLDAKFDVIQGRVQFSF
jgi:phosphate-selective porin OprO/OprP